VRFIVLCLCLLSFNAFAVNVSDLYRISVAVDDQGEESRKLGVQWAFQQLLIKVSGYQEVLANPTLIAASQNAERYMQGFSYQQDSVDDQVYLQAWFSKALIIPLMKRAQAPIWGENRPLLLHWLAIEPTDQVEQANEYELTEAEKKFAQAGVVFESDVAAEIVRGERLLVSEQVPEWQTRFERAFSERGLPVLWPIADLEDQTKLPLNQLWWLFPEAIKQASLRYQADAVLAGKLNQSAQGIWYYEGLLFHGEQERNIAAEGDTPLSALTLAAAEAGHYFADQFAIKSDPMSGRSGIGVVVKKVQDFTAYSQVLAYFKSISGVRGVEVAQVEKDNLQLYLSLEGDWDKVQRIIRLDNKLSILQEKEFEWAQ
jgi:hypothetical protein